MTGIRANYHNQPQS